ncbi:MAG: hypothetical protein U0974_10910 [Gemmatimonadales bacterium]|nr:hypothetical protein [Gemmatimonadales bacterium]MDZ4390222.1 hypothetical protein [Gemmatimonadales bacterium]
MTTVSQPSAVVTAAPAATGLGQWSRHPLTGTHFDVTASRRDGHPLGGGARLQRAPEAGHHDGLEGTMPHAAELRLS